MRIAIQASDLDHARIDGTRVYLAELLKRFGPLSPETDFLLYHAEDFNPVLAPPQFSNYEECRLPFAWSWMQTRFALALFRDNPKKLFLPIQAAPLILPHNLEVTVTVHDLAWRKYPETFSPKDRFKLDLLLGRVVKRANKIIAVSQATKDDLLLAFPELTAGHIRVIHHGFDRAFFEEKIPFREVEENIARHNLEAGKYILYVGALQPRKNLVRLIQAFEQMKASVPEAKLVLAGEKAWLWEPIIEAAERSLAKKDIILTGRVSFADLRILYQGARLFAFPSLYEGFGLPILEAFASGIPVLGGENSSLREVGGEGALYCQAEEVGDIAEKLRILWENQDLRERLVAQGSRELDRFSWEKCAEKTLAFLEE